MSIKQAEWMMLFVTFSWSSSYLLMKIALEGVDPFNLMALRFAIAFVCVVAIFYKSFKICTKRTLFKAFIMGFSIYAAIFGTITGLKHTTASTAAFLGTTTVVLVPILESIWLRKLPQKLTILSVGLAFVGLVLFTVKDGLSLDIGALYCLWGAFLYAVNIIIVGKFAKEKDTFVSSLLQFAVVAVLSTISSFIFEAPRLPQTSAQWWAVIALALVCSAFCFVMQSVVQRYLEPAKIGLIFSTEPVFAAILAYFFLGETMDLQGILGATLIMVAVVLKNIINKARYFQIKYKKRDWVKQ